MGLRVYDADGMRGCMWWDGALSQLLFWGSQQQGWEVAKATGISPPVNRETSHYASELSYLLLPQGVTFKTSSS